jgi:small subunit ribosomal protein S10
MNFPTKFKLRIIIKAYDSLSLEKSCESIFQKIKELKPIAFSTDMKIKGPITLPCKRRKYCLLTSPHGDKDAREQFEIRIHKRILDVCNITPAAIEALCNLDLGEGVYLTLKKL